MKHFKIKCETQVQCHERHSLDRRAAPDQRPWHNDPDYSPEWETKAAISAILDITLKPYSIKQQLKAILDVLVSISWLGAVHKGAIFVVNARRELVMVVQHRLHEALLEKCARVPFGYCLCGRAAESREVIFKTCVDHDHEISYDGMQPHGHYNVPLLDDHGSVIGVLVLYLEHGHRPHPEEAEFMRMLGNTLSNIIVNRNLKLCAEVSRIRLHKAQTEMMQKLVAAAEFRDNETGEHIKRMSQYAVTIARKLGLGEEECKILELAAPMHDIGKVGISDTILLKPGPLTPEEFATMQQHPEIGARILTGDHPLIKASRDIALTHHEKWDGSGYPRGLAGEEIPLFGRICALTDVFDALTSERPYKTPWPLEKALDFIREQAGSHFDPRLVDVFFECLPEILAIKSIYNENHQEVPAGASVLAEKEVSDTIVSWRPGLSINIAFIDKQHQYLINLINRVHNAIEKSDASEVVEALLDMKQYGQVHFKEEEELMRRHEYPGLENHIELHQGFIRKTEQFLDEIERTPLAVSTEMSHYLMNWLITHIQTVDADYGRYIAARAASGNDSAMTG